MQNQAYLEKDILAKTYLSSRVDFMKGYSFDGKYFLLLIEKYVRNYYMTVYLF